MGVGHCCLFAVALLVATAGLAGAQTAPSTRFRVAEVPSDWFGFTWEAPPDRPERYAAESDLIQRYPGRILRRTDLLALKLDNGLFVWLHTLTGGGNGGFGCCEYYALHDYWPDIGQYVVAFNHGEGLSYLIVSARTAEAVEASWMPHRAPADPALFATANTQDCCSRPGIEVWRMIAERWHRLYDCQDVRYGIEFARWESPTRAILRIDQPERREFALEFMAGSWRTDACVTR